MFLGNGGWVAVHGLPGLEKGGCLYLRLAPDESGRMRMREVYVDGRGAVLDLGFLQALPVAALEAEAQAAAARILAKLDAPGPDLSTLASYFATTKVPSKVNEADWVALSMWSQIPGQEVVKRVPRRRLLERVARREIAQRRLTTPPNGQLTEDFFRTLAAAYERAVAQGGNPAPVLAAEAGVSPRTVHRWVYMARKAGVMPPGTRGVAGSGASSRGAAAERD